ncbi:TPA: hypothetical protein ACNVX4_004774 [Pseudomonas aeruginosa]
MSKELNKAPVEQAGGDERDFQAKGAQEVPSPVSKEYDRHLISLLRKGEALPGHQEEAADEIERLRDWNDHLNNTVLPNILNPNFLMLMKGGERLLDLCTKDGEFIGVSLNDMKDVFDWMVTHARIAPDQAALAQPSPAQAEKAEVVARVVHSNPVVLGQCGPLNANDELMTVAQHAASVARWAEMFNRVEQQRDAALAEVERLRQFERICEGLPQDAIDGGWTVQGIRGYAKRLEDQLKAALAEVAGLRSLLNSLLCYVERDIDRMRSDRDKSDNKEIYDRSISLAMERLKAAQNAVFTTEPGCDTAVELAAQTTQAQHSVPELLVRAEDFVSGKEVPQAWLDVQAERRRQITAEGWTPEHDDLYCAAELPRAAAAYILNGANDEAPAIWPFSAKWWKPRDARSNYVRAGALILAEIERLDRAAPGKEGA